MLAWGLQSRVQRGRKDGAEEARMQRAGSSQPRQECFLLAHNDATIRIAVIMEKEVKHDEPLVDGVISLQCQICT